jgi:hypothetical protein
MLIIALYIRDSFNVKSSFSFWTSNTFVFFLSLMVGFSPYSLALSLFIALFSLIFLASFGPFFLGVVLFIMARFF